MDKFIKVISENNLYKYKIEIIVHAQKSMEFKIL